MRKFLFLLLTAMLAWGADDDWAKVRAIRGGTEIRVFKKGSTQPIVAKMDEAGDENLVVVLKNEQVAIPREQTDRLDARPAPVRGKPAKTTTTTTTTTMDPPDGKVRTSVASERAGWPLRFNLHNGFRGQLQGRFRNRLPPPDRRYRTSLKTTF